MRMRDYILAAITVKIGSIIAARPEVEGMIKALPIHYRGQGVEHSPHRSRSNGHLAHQQVGKPTRAERRREDESRDKQPNEIIAEGAEQIVRRPDHE